MHKSWSICGHWDETQPFGRIQKCLCLRFLESEIDFKGHDFELIPFGAGKRICPGLPLAHKTLHLMVPSLVHNFEWKLADGLIPEHMNMKEQFEEGPTSSSSTYSNQTPLPEAMDYQTMLVLLITFVSTASIFTFILRLFKQTSESTQLPPGPRPFPIIGNMLELGKNPHKALTKLSRIYGPLMTLKLGSITTIVISSPQVAKQVLHENGQAFSSRTIPHSVHALDHHKYSILWLPPSPQWRKLRRACATKIFSPQVLDSTQILRQEKIRNLLDFVKERSKKGEVVDIGEAIFTTILNSISTTFFSMDLSNSSSEKSQEFKSIFRNMMAEAGRPNVADFFPILRPLDPQRALARMNNYFKKMFKIIDGIIEERLTSRVLNTNSKVYKDVLDSLLNNIEETGSQLSRNEMLHLFLDLFVAGIDTTSSTVEWIMAELLRNPDKLAKARKELSQTIGKDVTLEEPYCLKLSFLRAVVKETLRLHPPAPFLVPHKCDEMINISGFKVLKNAQVLVNVWGMGRDPTIWENPEVFMPERFLESEIDFKGHDFELIPFGAGKRICPGLSLGHRTMHLMVASLVHNFEWKLADGLMPEQMNMEEQYGMSLKMVQSLRSQVMDCEAVLLLLITFVSASILIFIRRLFNQTSESTKLPPGPRPFPI
ncbi:Geraniol 8-hydroxylase, partial [Mucuna pruriens]